MAYKDDGLPQLLEILEFLEALRLKEDIAHRKGLVHDQNFRINVDRHREGQAHEHTAGVGFHGLMDKLADIREFQDILQPGVHLLAGKADHHAV